MLQQKTVQNIKLSFYSEQMQFMETSIQLEMCYFLTTSDSLALEMKEISKILVFGRNRERKEVALILCLPLL